MFRTSLTSLFLIFTLISFSQVEVNEQCQSAYTDILALRFDEAKSKLSIEKTTTPDNLFVPYLENYIDVLTVFIGENEEEFDILENNKSKRINRIKKLSDTSRFKNYMLGNIHLQWAVARLKFREYVTAAFEINKAYRLLDKNVQEFPDFIPNNVSLGVLHIMIGMVPEKYQWLLNLISMEGTVEQGRAELQMVLDQSNENDIYNYLHDETLFYLGFVELNINPDNENLDYLLKELEKGKDQNLLLTYLSANILMQTGQNDEALSTLEKEFDSDAYFSFYYLRYLEGRCNMRKLDSEAANINFHHFLKNFKGKNYIKDAWRKIAWTYLFENDTSMYYQTMQKVIDAGNDDVDIDKEALKEAKKEIISNIDLLKTRLLFDGGYYQSADSILQHMDTVTISVESKVERTYRSARVAHEEGNTDKAKAKYKKTIVNGSDLDRYFAGNSALKLAELYEIENDINMSLFYYNLCLDLDFDEYENSIHSKAKAGIERLEEN